jgi:clan AA aspartic protease (TIGR02281 family)
MFQSRLSPAALFLIFGNLAVLLVACGENKQKSITGIQIKSSPIAPLTVLSTPQPPVQSVQPSNTIKTALDLPNAFALALDKAESGLSISQWAQSPDDWQLAIAQFRDAIALMKRVPPDSPNFPYAQTKIAEFQHEIQYAKQQIHLSKFPVAIAPVKTVAVVLKPKPKVKISPPSYISQPQHQHLAHSISKPVYPPPFVPVTKSELFVVPIKRRIGGTPIVEVTFNGKQRFEMIVDTGASGTVITQQMAKALGVVPVGNAKANTVNSKSVEFPVGYLDSIEVGGVVANQIPVAIAGQELETGLLGHDFFGNYDVTIKRNTIEFRPQSDKELNAAEIQPVAPTLSKEPHF